MTKALRVGLLGCGNVGAALAHLLVDDAERIAARTGMDLQVAAVAVRSLSRERDAPVPASVFTTDAGSGIGETPPTIASRNTPSCTTPPTVGL